MGPRRPAVRHPITWFLIGGDLYTAYTFIAVPALAFGAGAVAFFAVPYTIVAYPIFFVVFGRLWYVCHKHHYITAGDFVRGRFGNRWLALAGFTFPGYTALYTVIANLALVVVLTPVFNAMSGRRAPSDETAAADYYA